MTNDAPLRGKGTQGNRPDWAPLLGLVGEDGAGDFMWMYEVTLDEGGAVQVYRHRDTREWLHLGDDGRAYLFRSPDLYEAVDPQAELLRVSAPEDPDGDWPVFLDDTLRTAPPPPERLAREVAHSLVRAFAAVDHWRREVLRDSPGLAGPELAGEIEDLLAARLDLYARVYADGVHNDLLILLPEAIDNLGCGERLDPSEVPAFSKG